MKSRSVKYLNNKKFIRKHTKRLLMFSNNSIRATTLAKRMMDRFKSIPPELLSSSVRVYPMTTDECYDGLKSDKVFFDEVGQWDTGNNKKEL